MVLMLFALIETDMLKPAFGEHSSVCAFVRSNLCILPSRCVCDSNETIQVSVLICKWQNRLSIETKTTTTTKDKWTRLFVCSLSNQIEGKQLQFAWIENLFLNNNKIINPPTTTNKGSIWSKRIASREKNARARTSNTHTHTHIKILFDVRISSFSVTKNWETNNLSENVRMILVTFYMKVTFYSSEYMGETE